MSQTNDQPRMSPAEAYERALVQPVFKSLARRVVDITQPSPGDRVLDVATGTGICLREVADRVGDSCHLVGLDKNPNMIEVGNSLAEKSGVQVEWHEGSADHLPFPDESFDYVFCQLGVQFFPDRPEALTEMRRVLVDGGQVAIAVWQQLDKHPHAKAIDDAGLAHTGTPLLGTPFGPFSLGDPDELRQLIGDAGFQNIQVHQESFESRRDDPVGALRMDVAGATAVLPALQQMEPAERESLVTAIVNRVEATLEQYVVDGVLINDWHANIATATK